MGDQHTGAGELPELPESESYEEDLVDELDGDLEPESDDLRQLWQPVHEANQQSLERVYARLRLAESARPPLSPVADTSRQSSSPPASAAKGSPPMQTLNTTVPTPGQAPGRLGRPRSLTPSRLTSIAAVLATGLLLTGTLLGFLYFRGGRPAQPVPAPQLTAKLACHSTPFESTIQPTTNFDQNHHLDFFQLPLDWSARGDVSYAPPNEFFSGQTCAVLPFAQAARKYYSAGWAAQVAWSPDGTRLVLLSQPAVVLDTASGRVIATLQGTANTGFQFPPQIGQAAWTADGKQIAALVITSSNNTTGLEDVQIGVWDSRTGSLIRTALRFNNLPFEESGWISPNGAYVALLASNHSIQIWNIATGKLISATPPTITSWVGTVAWSPDSAYFAYGISSAKPAITPGKVKILSTATGLIVATLIDTDTFEGLGLVDGLAWSPNGEYLAETSGKITIWDTSTWQRVAIFGSVVSGAPDFSQITAVTWSPDSSMLATVAGYVGYTSILRAGQTPAPSPLDPQSRLYIWKLTPVTVPTALPATPLPTPTATLTTSPGVSSTPTPGSSASPVPTQLSTPTDAPGGPSTPTPTPIG